jgi:L-ascorbate 6-phosphate lactonase
MLKHVDVLFFSPTEHDTNIEPSVILINTLEPDYILPQHHSTFRTTETNYYWTVGYPIQVYNLLSQSLKERYHILKTGEKLEIK